MQASLPCEPCFRTKVARKNGQLGGLPSSLVLVGWASKALLQVVAYILFITMAVQLIE